MSVNLNKNGTLEQVAGGGIMDAQLDANSVNGVQNKVVTENFNKTYKTDDTASVTVNDSDYVPMSTNNGTTKKKVLWSTLIDKIKTAITGAVVKTSVAKTGSGSTVTTTISANTSMDDVVGTLLNNDSALKSDLAANTLGVKVSLTTDYQTLPNDGYITVFAPIGSGNQIAVIINDAMSITASGAGLTDVNDSRAIFVKAGMRAKIVTNVGTGCLGEYIPIVS